MDLALNPIRLFFFRPGKLLTDSSPISLRANQAPQYQSKTREQELQIREATNKYFYNGSATGRASQRVRIS